MKKVILACCFIITIISSFGQNAPLQKDTIYLPKPKTIRYWNHSEVWINRSSTGFNIINGLSINKTNFIGIGIGASMNDFSRFHAKYLTFGIRYHHDFMTNSKVSPFVYTNTGFEYGFGPNFVFREMNLTNSIGTGVKFHTKKDITFGLSFELKNNITLYRSQVEYKGSKPMVPLVKLFINFGSGYKSKKQEEKLKVFY